MKWIGAWLIIAGCSSIGIIMGINYRKELKALQDLSFALTNIASDLTYRLTPLPDLFRNIGRSGNGSVYTLFSQLGEALENQIAPDAGYCLDVILRSNHNLPKIAKRVLGELRISLGNFDAEGQLRMLSAVKDLCDREWNALTNQKEDRIRRYRTLGICAGVALAILLL